MIFNLLQVPGPRSFSLLPLEFPWRDSVDSIEEISSPESFKQSLELCRNGLLVGPSSGLCLRGLIKFLEREKLQGRLDNLRNEDGEIVCMFSTHSLCLSLNNRRRVYLRRSTLPLYIGIHGETWPFILSTNTQC